jgi:hypothetical protein
VRRLRPQEEEDGVKKQTTGWIVCVGDKVVVRFRYPDNDSMSGGKKGKFEPGLNEIQVAHF